jgi:hypothetical protein
VKYSATEKYLGVNLYRHNGGVNLEVVDHGIGISVKEQPKIFEKFYRVGDPLVHNTKGDVAAPSAYARFAPASKFPAWICCWRGASVPERPLRSHHWQSEAWNSYAGKYATPPLCGFQPTAQQVG